LRDAVGMTQSWEVAAAFAEDVLPMHLATVVFPERHPLEGQRGDVLVFAVRQPDGLLLYDTGIGEGSGLIDRFYQPVRTSLADALADHGHQLADVTAVVNSHLHFDHCGNNHLLPGVPIYAQATELELARTPRYTVPDWIDFPGAEYRVIDGDQRIATGVHIVATPGHTGGHQSLVLDRADGPIVLAGQAIYSRAECEHLAAHGTPGDADPDSDDSVASANRLLALHPRRVHFSHDKAVWHRPR
jgi:glyoxylase-like metal-dependent hydrolase (beta-lactamase superfamily II)